MTTEYVIRIVALADGRPSMYTGRYLKRFDASFVHPVLGYDGGLLDVTSDPAKAERFPDVAAALEKWREAAPAPYHLRWDGKMNRPLTSFTIEVLQV